MLALIKGVVLSLKPILKSWQLCLSFKLDERNIDHDFLSLLFSFFFIYLPNNLYLIIDCIILIKSIIINKLTITIHMRMYVYKYSFHIIIFIVYDKG